MPLVSLARHHTGFDWFVATVFILMGGNRERAWKLLNKTTALLASGYVWFRRLHASVRTLFVIELRMGLTNRVCQ